MLPAIAATVAWTWHAAAAVIAAGPVLLALAAAAAAVGQLARVIRLPRAARPYYLAARWHRLTWRRLARRLDLARPDPHRPGIRVPATSTATIRDTGRRRLLYPRARFRADPYGLAVRIRTVPGTGRAEVENVADHLADAWGAWRVSITQPRPRRLEVRAFRRDPLCDPYPVTSLPRFDGRHLHLGRDESGTGRRVSLANHAGMAFSGNPGRGKTEAALSLVWQFSGSPAVELYILDGGALDWQPFSDGAKAYVTELDAAVDLLTDLAAGMNERRRIMPAELGVRNMWAVGPTPEWPLRVVLVEEAPAFLHVAKKQQTKADEARGFLAGLLRRGRAPGYLTILMTQKATTTGGLDPDLRDLCGLRWSFGVATTEAAAAILGAEIRDYPSLSPVALQGDQHVGVASTLLRTGLNPYTLLRFPAVGEDQADAAAAALARRQLPAVTGDQAANVSSLPVEATA
jgi:DNA segregation ATPase FtsK/SpoIIIE, S-DNA-T family